MKINRNYFSYLQRTVFLTKNSILILLMLNCSREQSDVAKVSMLEVFPHRVSLFISSLCSGAIFSKPRAPGLLRVVLEGLCFTLLSQKNERLSWSKLV